MKTLLTPRQIASAINVSESSIKRWCDKGKIQTSYTAGGHRRVAVQSLLEFLRNSKHELIDPKSIGFPERSNFLAMGYEEAVRLIVRALVDGDEFKLKQAVVELFLAEENLPKIFDDYLARAFHDIGNLWECGRAAIYQERRACQISLQILSEIRSWISEPSATSPIAFGAAPGKDNYGLPTAMVELVLRNANWNATSLGANLPLEELAESIVQNRPKLFWLSVSYIESPESFVSEYQKFYMIAGGLTTLVLGGQAITEDIQRQITYSAFCRNLQELDSFARSIPRHAY